MTPTEIKEEFLVRYNGRASNNAPALDDYEISVFLTHAQLALVKESMGLRNLDRASYEGSEKRRRNLSFLTKNFILNPINSFYQDATIQIASSPSILAKLPADLLYIVQEQVKAQSTDECINGKFLRVKPVTHDEYFIQKDNPFKKPSKELVWRMDVLGRTIKDGRKSVELIHTADYSIAEYRVRYVKYPSPIILSDLTLIDPALSINGLTTPQDLDVPDDFLLEIIMRAVTVAQVQQVGDLGASIQINTLQ